MTHRSTGRDRGRRDATQRAAHSDGTKVPAECAGGRHNYRWRGVNRGAYTPALRRGRGAYQNRQSDSVEYFHHATFTIHQSTTGQRYFLAGTEAEAAGGFAAVGEGAGGRGVAEVDGAFAGGADGVTAAD